MTETTTPEKSEEPKKFPEITMTFSHEEQQMLLAVINNLLKSAGLDGFSVANHLLMKLSGAQRLAQMMPTIVEQQTKPKKAK